MVTFPVAVAGIRDGYRPQGTAVYDEAQAQLCDRVQTEMVACVGNTFKEMVLGIFPVNDVGLGRIEPKVEARKDTNPKKNADGHLYSNVLSKFFVSFPHLSSNFMPATQIQSSTGTVRRKIRRNRLKKLRRRKVSTS